MNLTVVYLLRELQNNGALRAKIQSRSSIIALGSYSSRRTRINCRKAGEIKLETFWTISIPSRNVYRASQSYCTCSPSREYRNFVLRKMAIASEFIN